MFTKIRESVLLQLTLLMVLILAVLTGMMLVAQNYIHKVEAINTATLAESFLTRTDESLKSYLDTLRYHASYLCRYSFVQEICQGTAEEAQSADAAAKLAQISSIYSKIAVQEHEIVGAAF